MQSATYIVAALQFLRARRFVTSESCLAIAMALGPDPAQRARILAVLQPLTALAIAQLEGNIHAL